MNKSSFFDRYVDESKQLNDKVKEKLKDKLHYIDVFRLSYMPGTQEKYQKDPKFLYFEQCQKDNELVLPILDYVND